MSTDDFGFEPEEVQDDFGFEVEEQPQAEMSVPEISPAEAAFKGAQQGLTFGMADELSGVVGAGIEAVAGERMPEESKMDQLMRTYREYRDLSRRDFQQAEQAQPGAFMTGDIGGGFLMPGGGLRSAGRGVLGLAGKEGLKAGTKRAAAAGAATGALETAGRTEEDLASLEGARDVALGAGGGGLIGGVLGKIGKRFTPEALDKGAKEAAKDANIAALKSIGAKAKDMKEEFGLKTNTRATTETAKGTGQTLLDENLLKTRQGIDDLKEGLVTRLDEVATQRINPSAKRLDELGNQMPIETFSDDFNSFIQKVDDDVTKVIEGQEFAKGSDRALYNNMQEAVEKLGEQVDNALNSPNKIEELVNVKRRLQSQVNWDDPQANAYNEFLVKMQSNVSNLINNMSAKINPEIAKEMVDANRVYGNLSRANRIAGDELAREMAANEGIGFRDYLAAGVISAVGENRMLGPAVIAGKKAVEKVTGKDAGKIFNTLEAFQKNKRAQKLARRAESPGVVDRSLSQLAEGAGDARAVQAGAALMDTQDAEAPYRKNQIIGNYIENATPEGLNIAASQIRESNGKDGERLASTLERLAEKDQIGRRALLFSILQDPNNRKMLGLEGEDTDNVQDTGN